MTLEQELTTEQVGHLDLLGFCQVVGGTAVRQALSQMREQQVNVCLVMESDTLKGILTDRDVLTKVANHPETLDQPIETVMTANPITIGPETSAAQALWLMDQHGFRNLPVVEADGEPEAASGRVLGVMTHQAVINYLAARYPIEVLNRSSKPDQFPRRREGGD